MLRPYHTRQARHLVEAIGRLCFGMKLVCSTSMGRSCGPTAPGAGRSSARSSTRPVTAGPIESYRFDGKTDPQIVRDLLSLAGIREPGMPP